MDFFSDTLHTMYLPLVFLSTGSYYITKAQKKYMTTMALTTQSNKKKKNLSIIGKNDEK